MTYKMSHAINTSVTLQARSAAVSLAANKRISELFTRPIEKARSCLQGLSFTRLTLDAYQTDLLS